MSTKKDIYDYIINKYKIIDNENIPIVTLLKIIYNCNCTDCGGDDSISSCKIEDEYYNTRKSNIRISSV